MKNRVLHIIVIIIFPLGFLVGGLAMAQEIPNKVITVDSLYEMFANIEKSTDWNMKGDMLWGYFFTHNDPGLLQIAKEKLVKMGYTYVDIYLSDKEDKNEPDLFWLHVEKIETHTPQSLDRRNDEFYIFAYELGLDSYDGMDVGPVTP